MRKKTILRRRDGEYDIYAKNDGVDYWRLVRACIDENIDQAELIRDRQRNASFAIDRDGVKAEATVMAFTNPKRLVLRMDAGGRRFVVKRAYMGSPGFKRFLPGVIGLTYFTRIMKLIDAAVRGGCDATQDCFLVAERWIGLFRVEVWALMQYVEGATLGYNPQAREPHLPALRTTALELFRYNLSMDDVAPGNFLVGGDRVRAIDISCRPFFRLQKAFMTWKLNRRYNLGLPVTGAVDKILYALAAFRYRNSRKYSQENI